MSAFTLRLLGELTQIRTGKLDANASSTDGIYPFFTCAKEALRIATFSYDSDCVLVAGNGDLNVKHYNGKFDAYQRTYIVEPLNPSVLNTRYLFHFLDKYVEKLRELSIGGVIKYIKIGNLTDARIPLPEIEEQRRIAAILDQAETLRTQRRSALAQLDRLTQAIFLDMFGDAERHQWPLVTVADIVDKENGSIRTGPFGSQLLHSEFVDEGVAVLGIDNAVTNEFQWAERRYITPAKYQELKRYTVRPCDVLITIMGTCGRCAVVPDDIPLAINTKHLCCISINRQQMTPSFLHTYFLLHPTARKYLEQTAKGAVMAGLNLGIIKAMPIPLPPLPLQQTFATRIEAIEALKASHRSALSTLDALFAALQQRAFAGELWRQMSGYAALTRPTKPAPPPSS